MRQLKSTLAVIGAVAVLALAGNTVAQAATGQSFLLGKGNNANAQTTLARTTAGTVLSLKGTSSTGSPLAVNGTGKVTNLNADLVDGYNSTDMRNRTYVFTRAIDDVDATFTVLVDMPLPSGTYELGYSVFPKASYVADDNITCYFGKFMKSGGAISFVGEDRSVSRNGSVPAVSGTAVVSLDSTQGVYLSCASTKVFGTFEGQPIQVYASPTKIIGGTSNLRAQAPRAQLKH